jgi:hypothetical protein
MTAWRARKLHTKRSCQPTQRRDDHTASYAPGIVTGTDETAALRRRLGRAASSARGGNPKSGRRAIEPDRPRRYARSWALIACCIPDAIRDVSSLFFILQCPNDSRRDASTVCRMADTIYCCLVQKGIARPTTFRVDIGPK